MEYKENPVIIEEEKSFIEKIQPYLYLAPVLILLGIFMFWPFIQTIVRSLFGTDSFGQMVEFIGLEHYITLFTDSSFWNSMWVTFKFVVVVVVVGIVIGFSAAILTQRTFPGIRIFTTSYAMPMAIASAGISMVFIVMLNPSIGIINHLLDTNTNFLADPDWALITVGVVTGWLNSGLNFLYFSSGLASIDDTLYESASIDGANGWQKFRYITIPSLKPIFFFVLVTNIINAFQGFGQINILTRGGPGEATNVIVYDIYRNAFLNYRYGYASAESVVLFLIVMVLTIIMFILRRRENE